MKKLHSYDIYKNCHKKKKTYSTDNNLIDFKKKAFNFFKTSNAK